MAESDASNAGGLTRRSISLLSGSRVTGETAVALKLMGENSIWNMSTQSGRERSHGIRTCVTVSDKNEETSRMSSLLMPLEYFRIWLGLGISAHFCNFAFIYELTRKARRSEEEPHARTLEELATGEKVNVSL